jgi:hypothetical protein
MKNAVYCDIKPSSCLTGNITSPLQSPAGDCYVRFGVSTAANMKNAVYWDIKPSSCPTGNITSPLQSPAGECYVRFEVSTAANMKNAVYWDIKPSSCLIGNITSPLQSPAGECYVRFEVFTAATMNNAVYWDIKTQFVCYRKHITSPLESTAVTMNNAVFSDVTSCGSYKNPNDGGDTFFRNLGSYMSHTASLPKRRHYPYASLVNIIRDVSPPSSL